MKITLEINLGTVLRWLLGGIFVWAAISKLANLQEFYASTVAYQLPVPLALLRLGAVTLPWLELFCGLLVLGNHWQRPALLWVAGLCAVFTLATAQAWIRGLAISCGCLNLEFLGLDPRGQTTQLLQTPGFAFVRALLLLAAAIYLLRQAAPVRPAGATAGGPQS